MFKCFGKRSKIYIDDRKTYIIEKTKNREYSSYPRKFTNFIYK